MTGSPFWNFSLATYGRPGVPPACLKLQDDSGVDVNVLLFCIWLATTGRRISGDEMRKIVDAVESWRTAVVVPLRTARRALKDVPQAFGGEGPSKLRDKVKAMELEAERLQQEALFALDDRNHFGQQAEPGFAARANAERYAKVLGATFDGASVETIIAAALDAAAK